MSPHRPPVTWPSCSWTSTWSSADQPWPPSSTGNEPPLSFSSRARRFRSRTTAGSTTPPDASNGSSSGWRTSTTNARARARRSCWMGDKARSTAERMAVPTDGGALRPGSRDAAPSPAEGSASLFELGRVDLAAGKPLPERGERGVLAGRTRPAVGVPDQPPDAEDHEDDQAAPDQDIDGG